MSPLLLIALVGGGLVLLTLKDSKGAYASTLPAAWRPPANATVETVTNPKAAAFGVPTTLRRTSWHVPADASGQQAGTFLLTQDPTNAENWIMAFKSDAGGAGVLGYSQNAFGGQLAQAAAAGL